MNVSTKNRYASKGAHTADGAQPAFPDSTFTVNDVTATMNASSMSTQNGTAAGSAGETEFTADLHFRMSKKIAQLSKAIPHSLKFNDLLISFIN